MRLQAFDIEIVVGGEVIRLRPTLGAASRLERKYDGFHNLLKDVASGSVTAVSDVIKAGSGQRSALSNYLDSIEADQPLQVILDCIVPPIVAFVRALTGEDANLGDEGDSLSQERITFEEFHTRLFRIATGWLGWTPAHAWEATPAEILEAQKGRVEMLKAVFGGKESTGEETTTTDISSIRGKLNALGDMTNTTVT